MSEIGPIKVRPRFSCRMISCPAANGIICSICKPIATDEPSGTNSAIAWCMERSFDIALTALPLGLAFFHEGANAFIGVFGTHEFVEIDFFGPGQTFIEVHGVPGVDCLLGDAKRGRAQR